MKVKSVVKFGTALLLAVVNAGDPTVWKPLVSLTGPVDQPIPGVNEELCYVTQLPQQDNLASQGQIP